MLPTIQLAYCHATNMCISDYVTWKISASTSCFTIYGQENKFCSLIDFIEFFCKALFLHKYINTYLFYFISNMI